MASNRDIFNGDPYQFLFEKQRLATFENNWKKLNGFPLCTPEEFAAAGFINFSSKAFPDTVKCFACFKELCQWQEDDDPWKEHIRKQSDCPFVVFRKKQVDGLTTVEDFATLCFELKKKALQNEFEKVRNDIKDNMNRISKDLTNKLKVKK